MDSFIHFFELDYRLLFFKENIFINFKIKYYYFLKNECRNRTNELLYHSEHVKPNELVVPFIINFGILIVMVSALFNLKGRN